MEAAAFRLKRRGMCTRIDQCQHAILTVREGESKGVREWRETADADGI